MTCSTESVAQKCAAVGSHSNTRKLSTFDLRDSNNPWNHADLGVCARTWLDLAAKRVSTRGPPYSRCFRTSTVRICTHFF